MQEAKRERTEEEPSQPAQSPQSPTPEVGSVGASASEEVRDGQEEEEQFGARKRSKMKSYGGRKKKKIPRKKEEEEECRRQEEEIQKAAEALEKRKERISLSPRSPSPEKTLRVGRTERKYGVSRARRLVSRSAPSAPPPPLRDHQRSIDCRPTREDDVTISPAMTDLGKKRKIPARKCKEKETPGDGNKGCFSWKGEKIGLEELMELESFYEDLASSSEQSLETVLKAEPKSSSISREKDFFFEVYCKYQIILEMITNVSTATLMSLLSFHHLDNEDFKEMIMKKKKPEAASPPGSASSSVSTTSVPQPPVSVSLRGPDSRDEPLDLSLPTRERAREALQSSTESEALQSSTESEALRSSTESEALQSSTESEGLKKIKKEFTVEEGEKNQGKKTKGKVRNGTKKKIKEKTTRKIKSAVKEGNSIQTSNRPKKDCMKIKKMKIENEKSVFLSMEEKSQEVEEMTPPVQQLPDLGISETATTITIEDQSLWQDLESVSDLQVSPIDINVNFDLDLLNF